MTHQKAAWLKKPDPNDPMYDQSHSINEYKPYVHANRINIGPNVSKRTVPIYEQWWFTPAGLLIIAIGILCALNEMGCFDR